MIPYSFYAVESKPELIAPVPSGPSALYFLRRSPALANPHEILDVFRDIVDQWGKISSFKTIFKRTYVVADYEAIDTIFRMHDVFGKYPHHTADLAKLQALIGKGMLATHSDDEWSAHRQSMARPFSKSSVMKNCYPIVMRHVNFLLQEQQAADKRVCNVSELAMRLSGRVMSDILVPGQVLRDESFLEIKRILDASILDFYRWDYKWRARAYKAALRAQASQFVEAAAVQGNTEGLVCRMVKDEPNWRNDRRARERLLDRIINLVVAGYETTATTLNWVVHLLASHPEVQDRLRSEIDQELYGDGATAAAFDENNLLRGVLLEAMRLFTVLWFNIRYCNRNVVVNGSSFTAGARVMLLPFIANRSSIIYKDPDGFNPSRYLQGELLPLFPFGNGPRVCIGRALAELEMQMFVVGLLRRFRLQVGSAPQPIGGVLLQPDRDVKVHLTRRHSPAADAECRSASV
jgi:cytochrome P450